MTKMDLIERFIFKITSGRFIFTIVVAGVYAYLAITGKMADERINEITLIVLYAYFNIPRALPQSSKPIDEDEDKAEDKPKTV
ncbi:MAG TPA: hypothetical protein VMV86_05015 [Methanosarcinales archaeon]|nr:hypothetical protein [Methanosarcinales archaeon]